MNPSLIFGLAFASLASALYEWGSDICMDVEASKEKLRGTGCVAKGSIETNAPNCARCAFNYQCASGWCVDPWKLCYQSGVSCLWGLDAGCSGCTTATSEDLSKCNCRDTDFPNNWVKCTDGSENFDRYDQPIKTYERKENGKGGLAADDEFAIQAQCYHNRLRTGVGLGPLEWDDDMAKFITEWSQHLKETNACKMSHSSGPQRRHIGQFDYIGENLYWFATSGSIPGNEVPDYGRISVEAWYNEVNWFQYPGVGRPYADCPKRNENGRSYTPVGHFTQVMWDDTTHIACDYVTCKSNSESIMVGCVYGPGGNIKKQEAFNETVWCKLDQFHLTQRYGGVPACYEAGECADFGDGKHPAEGGEVRPTTTPSPYKPKDGKCPGKWGGECKFPWSYTGLGEFTSCQDAYDRLVPHNPWCLTESGQFDQCDFDEFDPDCNVEEDK